VHKDLDVRKLGIELVAKFIRTILVYEDVENLEENY